MAKLEPPHIAILQTPGMGHLIPLSEFAKRLVNTHSFSVTFIYFFESNSKSQQQFLKSLPHSITSISLPPVNLDDLPSNAAIETRMSVASVRSIPSIAEILQQLKSKHKLVAFVADLFGADAFDAAKEVNVPAYIFFPSNFSSLSLFLNLPKLHEEIKCEFRDLDEPVKLPGCVPIPGKDIPYPLQDKKDEAYSWLLHHSQKYAEADGILVNSFEELEPESVKILSEIEPGRPRIYAVGPLVQTGSGDELDESGCLAWLDEQPRGSVIFVSFGSGGTLSTEQTGELALGLEMSGQRFLWVVRSPSDDAANANYFDSESKRDPFEFLPEGFAERTKEVGKVVPSWAPQMKVLRHVSTGGFITHCGWNSTLESLANGVPMIGWPLFAEQRQSAVVLERGAKVALRVRFGEDGVARKEDIKDVVKELMEGKSVQVRVKELQLAGIKALEEEGASYMNLKKVVQKWKGFGGDCVDGTA